MSYIDGFVLPVPKKHLRLYQSISKKAGKIWRDYGALDYRECAGDDVTIKGSVPFPRMVKLKAGETVVFSWILYKSRAHRDQVNKKVMKDPRMVKMMSLKMPFDPKRMAYGGFKTIVEV